MSLHAVESASEPAAVDAWLSDVGMRVRLARVQQRLSQDVLAMRAGMSRVTLGSIERGEHTANVVSYARLAAATGLPIGELLSGYEAVLEPESRRDRLKQDPISKE